MRYIGEKMKTKSISKKTLIMSTAILSVVLLMGINVSATVNYKIQKMPIDEIEQKLNSVMNSSPYLKLETQANEFMNNTYNQSVKQELYERILSNLRNELPTAYDPICPLLAEILLMLVETCYLLFGHGVVGNGMMMTIVMLMNLCGSMIAGIALVPTLLILGCGVVLDAIGAFFGSEDIFYDFGIIGVVAIFCCALPLLLILLIIGIPFAYCFAVLVIMDDNISYINEHYPYP
jgi:hypothetical protein